jgi:NAD(P)-dependent dehydrogenase (short-subunit alcohol dehydrogenase family)
MSLSAEHGPGSPADRRLTLVTGGTRGIGAATALRLASAGHDLVLGFRSDTAAAEECRSTVEAAGARCVVVRADVADPAGIDTLFEAAAEVGRLTGVVNNAGATLHLGPLAETPVDVVRRTVDLNLTAALLVARAAVRAMGTSYGGRGGVLVNLSSVAARLGAAGEYVHYAAAKAGVEAFTRGLAQEVAGEGIRVAAVAPGLVRTRIHADAGDAARVDRVGATVPLGRAGEPAEVADAVAWLLSDRASYVSGATIEVTGGR